MKTLKWRVHTPSLLKEILNNKGANILHRPVQIFASILSQVAQRASELNDAKLNALMCRLTLYVIADPESPEYDKERAEAIMDAE
jgi:hypothetical protein